ncbi:MULTISPECIES: 2-oxo acid dehydrogenase subunit E2 [Streptomyces]|uniref:2-oxo acid dehydrogenase subunit E2 n=1 Tax=Streptomyces koyangensis TaxID=188770 RepID=A0A2P1BT40_9ACTN|nr:2-oxo acid dehydrogenase subunit E2 [Streptomyces koyangensis]AVI57429.1 AbmA4 [Streptomyces koyangensis]QRF05053.1 2-oxo acid dehydrogenase subunit E2 [Streptomyces koyangensis]
MSPAPTSVPLAAQRRHTLYFLDQVRSFAPVHLDTEVDMTAVLAHRAEAAARGRTFSRTSYVLHTAARVLAAHPDANAAVTGGLRPRVTRYPTAVGKLALDRTLDGHRVVLAAILPGLDTAGLDAIQDRIDHYRDGDPHTMPEFAAVRALHRAPWPAALLRFRRAARDLAARPFITGTFAVSSLGHRPVDGFHSMGGTTVTLGVGQVADRPVVRAGSVTVAPVLRLNLSFDHRVIDGAEAADVLAEIKAGLENFRDTPREEDGTRSTPHTQGVPAGAPESP